MKIRSSFSATFLGGSAAFRFGRIAGLGMFFWLLFFGQSFAQMSETDSLLKILPEQKGKARVDVLNKLTWKLRNTNPSEAIGFGFEAISLAEKLEYYSGLGDALSFSGVNYRNKGAYSEALELFFRALEISEKHDLGLTRAYSFNNIGDVLQSQGNYQEAKNYILRAIRQFQAVDDLRGTGYGYIRLGEVYRKLDLTDSALYAFSESLRIRLATGDSSAVETSLNRLGQIYNDLGDYPKALEYLEKSLFLSKRMNDLRSVSGTLGDIAHIYVIQERYDRAFVYADSSLQIAKEVGLKDFIVKAATALADIGEKTGDYRRAFEYQSLAAEVRADLSDEENRNAVVRLQKNYEVNSKQIEIDLLNKDKAISNLVIGVFFLVLLAVAALVYVYYSANRTSRHKNEVLQFQKNEIEEQAYKLRNANQEITKKNDALEEKTVALEQAYSDLQSAQSQLVMSEKMASLGQMVAGVAHEINNPINFVYAGTETLGQVFSELNEVIEKYEICLNASETERPAALAELQALKKEVEFEELRTDIGDLIADIRIGADRTAEIVKGLRTFSRLDEDDIKLADLHESIETTLILLHNRYKNRIEIVKDFSPEVVPINCYPGKINQALMNLLGNAVQAISGPGKIFISTRKSSKEMLLPETQTDPSGNKIMQDCPVIEISIRDTGKGMSEEIMQSIFQPFFTTKDVGEGTGLGLSITHGIIEKHFGQIEVKSKEGEGSEFTVILPIL